MYRDNDCNSAMILIEKLKMIFVMKKARQHQCLVARATLRGPNIASVEGSTELVHLSAIQKSIAQIKSPALSSNVAYSSLDRHNGHFALLSQFAHLFSSPGLLDLLKSSSHFS